MNPKTIHTFVKTGTALITALFLAAIIAACGKSSDSAVTDHKKTGELELKYADQLFVDFYEGGYTHIHIEDGTDYVLVPEGAEDSDLGLSDPVVIHQPLKDIYLAASSAMDFFVTLDSLEEIRSCSTSSADYTIDEVKRAIDEGRIDYVGKYSAPDYERIISTDCNIAIESTMITHSPEIREEFERLGIPVLVERSSYEKSPMGRLEWVKLYGVLLGKQSEADAFFDSREKKLSEVEKALEEAAPKDEERPSVAFFYISSNGYVNVRKPGDYISSMIEMAGGKYCLSELETEEENALSTMNINWEDFYRLASEADILIYNGTVDGGIKTPQDLIDKNPLFADFKAVKEGNVYCTNADMYQKSSSIVDVVVDMYKMINGTDADDLKYIIKL